MQLIDVDIRDAFFDEIYNIASKDRDVVFITADADAFSLRKYKKDFPQQFINIGVAEQNMIAVAAGLALSGKKVFVYAIIPFVTLRCYEHIKVNICSMNLPITIIGAGAGLSFGNDGATHHAVCDIAVMRTLSEMAIFNPADSIAAFCCAQLAYRSNGPVYVRLDKGKLPEIYQSSKNFSEGLSVLRQGQDICIVATGLMVQRAIEIADELRNHDIDAGVIDVYRLKPIDENMFLTHLGEVKRIVTVEENIATGGLGSIVAEILIDNQKNTLVKRIALKDEQCFCYGSREYLNKHYKIDKENVINRILEWVK